MASKLRRLILRKLGYARQESTLSPLDVAKIIHDTPAMVNVFAVAELLKRAPAVRFHTEKMTDELILFRSEKRPKNLLVCFTDKHGSLFGTVPVFLQTLGDDLFDVLVIHDRRRARFSFGIEGLTDSFFTTIEEVSRIAQAHGYNHIQTYGTSMGGYVAIRAGMMLSAKRAVSVGGSFVNQTVWRVGAGKLFPNGTGVCDCNRHTNTEILAYHSVNSYEDSVSAQRLKNTAPSVVVIPCASRKHDIFAELRKLGVNKDFLRETLISRHVDTGIYDKYLAPSLEAKLRDGDERKEPVL